MLKAIIVDDEKHCQDALIQLLENYSSTIELVKTVESVEAAQKAINDYEPDVVFLDVQMPGLSGFECLEQLHLRNVYPHVVFVTALEYQMVNVTVMAM